MFRLFRSSALRCGRSLIHHHCAWAALTIAVGLSPIGYRAVAAAEEDKSSEPSASNDSGHNFYVNPETGDDRATGLAAERAGADGPVKTIQAAIRKARPGDTVHLAPLATPYHDVVVLHKLHGEPGRPITVDGHGAIVTGVEPLAAADCAQVEPGLFRTDKLIPPKLLTPEDGVSRRWFFLFDGRINRMGRALKGKSAPYKQPEELAPGEWTYRRDENAFYIKIDPARQLAEYRIEWPQRSAGVQVSGDCSWLVVRNLIATHVYNDGYNIHGKTREVRFENIQAIECGDDGYSAHDDCQTSIDGFISIGNGTGIANAGHSRTQIRKLWIQDCVGFELLFLDEGYRDAAPDGGNWQSLVDCVIHSSSVNGVSVDGVKALGAPCRVKLENVLIRRAGATGEIRVSRGASLVAERTTFVGMNLVAGGAVELRRSILAGAPAPKLSLNAGAQWRADDNLYDLAAIKFGETNYAADRFDAYRQASGQDARSRWQSIPITNGLPGEVSAASGVDASSLPTR